MKNLLVIADKKGGKNIALTRALALQDCTGAKITLLGFCYADIHHPEAPEIAKLSRRQLENKVVEKRRQELKELVKQLKIKPSAVAIEVQWSKTISQAIIAYCDNHPVDMVIKSGNRSETILYTSTDWRLFRECSAPVMIAASKSWRKKPRVLVALDFAAKAKSKAKLNHAIMQHAQTLATAMGEEVHVAYAVTVPEVLADLDLINPKKYAWEKRRKLQPEIDRFCEKYNLGKEYLHIRQGSAEKVVPSIASKLKADVVVTGTLGRKGVKGKLLGNTAEGILSRARTDIIAIKP